MLGLGEKMVARKNSRRMWPWPSPLLNVFLLGLGTERHVIVSMNAFSFYLESLAKFTYTVVIKINACAMIRRD